MAIPNKKPKLAVEDIDEIKEDIRDIRNDIEKMKGDTHSISRIMNLVNASQIEKDLTALVGSSEYKAAILELTKEEISRSELARALGLDERNLNKFVDPFLDKGYVAKIKRGKGSFYRRSESVDLIGIERIAQIESLIEAWHARRQSKQPAGQPSSNSAGGNHGAGNRYERQSTPETAPPGNG